jgi:hypothetical protein
VQLKRLARAHAARETAGFLALPSAYVALMGAGVLARSPSLALLTLGLVFMLVVQQRSASVAASVVPPPRKGEAAPWPQADVDAADLRFLRQTEVAALTDLGAYLVLLLAVDRHLRAVSEGTDPGLALVAGAGAALAAAALGRAAARRIAWSGFAAAFPGLWSAAEALNLGRAARSPRAYLAWRASAPPAE